MMKPALLQKTSLQQTLTPQQIQYLRLLQMPIVSLEQTVMHELETNPFLDELNEDSDLFSPHDVYAPAPDQEATSNSSDADNFSDSYNYIDDFQINSATVTTDNNLNDNNSNNFNESFYGDDATVFTDDLKINKLEADDSYDYYSYQWEDDSDFNPKSSASDDDFEPFQAKYENSFYDDLLSQLSLHNLTDEENLIAIQLIGNIDEDGYLRRELDEIITETNSIIAEHNFSIQKQQYEFSVNPQLDKNANPAKKYLLSNQSVDILKDAIDTIPELQKMISDSRRILDKYKNDDSTNKILSHIKLETAEKVLKIIQGLDPPGIGARTVQECLVIQLNNIVNKTEPQRLALLILSEHFNDFSKKHFESLQKKLEITEDQIRDAFDEIKHLNPKPGGDDFKTQINSIIPDFTVRYDEELDDLIIYVNDSTIPNLKVSSTYDKIRQEARNNKNFNKETKEWIREKFENARFFIQAIKQRNITMLMVMTSIAQRQKDFFSNKTKDIKPMIYKDIADDTALDISTICRVVNGKYALMESGIFELKYFFSEALPNDAGEEISTTVIKDKIKHFISIEPKNKPFSDDKLCKMLKEEGCNVARRTIAKYRETLKIPVARLRREI